MQIYPRRRSCLVVPGSSEKMLRKAVELNADEIIFDLEDAVDPPNKSIARENVSAILQSGKLVGKTIGVRINPFDSEWGRTDIVAVTAVDYPPQSLIVPKVENESDLAIVSNLLDELERVGDRQPIGLQALVETAKGFAYSVRIASSASRLQSLILGYADLASSLGRNPSSGATWSYYQQALLVAARCAGIQAIDGPEFYFGEDGVEKLMSNSLAVSASGFDGKWAIHPSQIEPLNTAFTPGEEEIASARQIIAQLAENSKASQLNGTMIDEAMRLGALRTLSKLDTQA